VLPVLLFGCTQNKNLTGSSVPGKNPETAAPVHLDDSNLVSAGYFISDRLIQNLRRPLNHEQPILIASLVDVKNMERSSDLGRMMAECIASRLAQKGYAIKELKLREDIYIKEKAGEFLLSRKVTSLTTCHNAQALVVGTYARAISDLYISVRIISPENSRIISSCDLRLPIDLNLRSMLHNMD